MKRAQIIVLGVALAAGATAVFLLPKQQPAPAPAPVVQAPAIQTVEVLVAGSDLPMGTALTETHLKWQVWPQEAAGSFLTRTPGTDTIQELKGAIVRFDIAPGEPIRREKLIQANGSGFMSAILPAGRRAIAISIDKIGTNTAGGFILPNDRVDVIRTFRDDEATRSQGRDIFVSQTILRNIRVLAIGQNVKELDGQKVVVGDTATLELDPTQAETITLAQRVGQLSLALRSLADTNVTDEAVKTEAADANALTIVRFGISQQAGK